MAPENQVAILSQPVSAAAFGPVPPDQDNSSINRKHFPEGFVFGIGTSSFQVEGAYATDGKGPSVWDDFTLRTPAMIADGSNGTVAADMYNRFEEDIKAMKAMGFDSYRFSISWPRILPCGRCSGGVNRKGIDYYNRLIDTIIANGMEPKVTIFHWDLPHCLELEYGGFLSRKIVPDFVEFAELCFWEFGDRVTWWTTLNEPWSVAHNGYVRGNFPPGKPSCPPNKILTKLVAYKCVQDREHLPSLRSFTEYRQDPTANPAKDAYTVGRNLLLCHAAAVKSYRTRFQPSQNGQIGIVINSQWCEPYDPNSEDDIAAAKRAIDFMAGWFLEPVLYGHYPKSMTEFIPPENLAGFTPFEANALKGSTDYVGFNYYTTTYVSYDPEPQEDEGYYVDMRAKFHTERDGVPIGPVAGSSWLYIVPRGIYEHLVYWKNIYPDMPHILICENGMSDADNHKQTAIQACRDTTRVKYHQDHLANVLQAITKDKVDVRGYFAWSWCDNFEWSEGYNARFGINYVDFTNNQTRYPKDSAIWFSKFLKGEPTGSWPPIFKSLSNKRQIENSAENESEKRVKVVN